MKVKVQVVIESESGETKLFEEVALLERDELQSETLGLNLSEAQALLQGVQRTIVFEQVEEYLQQQQACHDCGMKRYHKDEREIVYRTLFGRLRLRSPRLFHCKCQLQPTRTFSPLANLLTERTAPERLYLESKFASLMSYGLTTKLLEEVLPLEGEVNAATVRNHLQQVAQRMEGELGEEQAMFASGCQREWEKLPRPELPLTVGIDGGYVHGCHQPSNKSGWFEVIVGKSITADGNSKCFGLVNGYDKKPKRRLFELLKSQGMQMNQQVTFLSDGGDTVRELQLYLNPQAEHLLDWFHVTMRLTVMNQMAKGLGTKKSQLCAQALKDLERIKWYLWHGNVFRALQIIEDLDLTLDDDNLAPEQRKLLKSVREFQTYIENNANFIPNYGERYRCDERISTGFAESTVNQVISKRFVKKQQMRWTQCGAHLLLQVRTRVLDEELEPTFRRWYPTFRQVCQELGDDIELAA